MTNSTTLGLVTNLKMMVMVVGVLNFAVPQSTPSSENLAIQRICRDLQGRKINFTNSNTLVGVATDRGARYL